MNMSSYKIGQFKKRRNLSQNVFRIIGFFAAIFAIWFLFKNIIVKKTNDIPLASPETIYNSLMSKRALIDKIAEMQTVIDSYNAELIVARQAIEENDRLKSELNRNQKPEGTLAHVLTLPNRSFYDTFRIDAGTNQNIEVDQTVYAFNSIAIGTISNVEEKNATVLLFSAPGRDTPGTASGTDVAVTLVGRGGGEYEVRIPRDLQFEVGGLITHQSIHIGLLAQIERVDTDPRDPFQKLYAKAPVNLQALKWVMVR